MSSKKTSITDTDGIKVFPQTTIDQVYKANGTDKFEVVEEFTEAEWNALTDTQKASIPLAKVNKTYTVKSDSILYKNGVSVEGEIDSIKNTLSDRASYTRLGTSNSTTATTISLSQSIDNFKYVIISLGLFENSSGVNRVLDCRMIPTQMFKMITTSNSNLAFYDGSSSLLGLVSYVSNTSVKMLTSNAGFPVGMYGIK